MEKVKPRIIFRSDGDPKIGLGHLFRMAALSEVLGDDFHRVFYTRADAGLVNTSLASFFNEVYFLNANEDLIQESKRLSYELKPNDIMVIDGYDLGPDYQTPFVQRGIYMVMMDDYHPFPVVADLVINIAGGDIAKFYTGNFYSRYLFGFTYSLLRKEFRARAAQKYSGVRNSLFLCLGGADPENRIAILLRDILIHFPTEKIHVVLGSAYANKELLFDEYGMYDRVKIHTALNAESMAHLMERASIGFCSSSTIAYEFLCCNENLVVVRTAANQVNLFNYLVESDIAASYTEWLKNKALPQHSPIESWRKEMLAFSYPELFRRISEEQQYHLEKAREQDMELYFTWANDPATRAQSFNVDPIPLESHRKWYITRLQDPNCLMLKLHNGEVPVAQIRYTLENGKALVNYSVDASFRGKGLSTLVLIRSMKYLLFNHPEVNVVEGWVKPGNTASLKAFRKCGFTEETINQEGVANHFFSLNIRSAYPPQN